MRRSTRVVEEQAGRLESRYPYEYLLHDRLNKLQLSNKQSHHPKGKQFGGELLPRQRNKEAKSEVPRLAHPAKVSKCLSLCRVEAESNAMAGSQL
jgi:hypothetical protein